NLFFEWSKSLENPNEYVLVEAFTDEGAEPHVKSDHFAAGLEAMRPHLASTPKIISRKIDGEGWDEMVELKIDCPAQPHPHQGPWSSTRGPFDIDSRSGSE